MRNFSGITTTKDLTLDWGGWTYQTETFAVDTESSVVTIGIGNHWLMDWGLWIGGDWVLASSGLGQTKVVTSTGTTTGSPTATQRDWFKIYADRAADGINDASAGAGFAQFTIGFAF